jgi:O-antigen biosynthesis protein
MCNRRLLRCIHASPLWCSRAGLIHAEPEAPVVTEGIDLTWYFRKYRDFLGSSSADVRDCVLDYLQNAAISFRNPNMIFDEFWYRREYPEADELVSSGRYRSGWEHYITEGGRKFYNPAFWFDERWYQKQQPDVYTAVKNRLLLCGFEHYLLYGIQQDLAPSIYFNPGWYRRRYLQDRDGGQLPIVHYLISRDKFVHTPVPFFNPDWYAKQYLSAASNRDQDRRWAAYEHYLLVGRRSGYSPSPYFNELAYRDNYPEVAEKLKLGVYASGLEHYANEGFINGFFAFTHLDHGGVDYASPEFLRTYGQSLSLNVTQIAQLRELVKRL